MEKINKRVVTKKIIEYFTNCSKCNKEIKGSSEGQVVFNLRLHKDGKGCKNE